MDDSVKKLVNKTIKTLLEDKGKMKDLTTLSFIPFKLTKEELGALLRLHKIIAENAVWKYKTIDEEAMVFMLGYITEEQWFDARDHIGDESVDELKEAYRCHR